MQVFSVLLGALMVIYYDPVVFKAWSSGCITTGFFPYSDFLNLSVDKAFWSVHITTVTVVELFVRNNLEAK